LREYLEFVRSEGIEPIKASDAVNIVGPSGFGVGPPICSGIRGQRKAAAPTSQLAAHSRSRDI